MTKAGLSDSKTSCIQGKESADPNMKTVLDAKGTPSVSDAQKYVPVILSCISKTDFSKVIVSASSSALTPDQQNCITTYAGGLNDSDFIDLTVGTADSQQKLVAACPGLSGASDSTTTPSNSASFSCSDIFVTDSGKNDPTSISGVKLGVCSANPTANWAAPVFGKASWAVNDSGNGFDIAVLTDQYTGSFTASDALGACNAIASYLATNNKADWPLSIGTGAGVVSKPSTVLATKPSSGTCAAA